MATHGRSPLQGIEDLLLFPMFGLVADFGLLPDVYHPLLGERCTDTIASQILRGQAYPTTIDAPIAQLTEYCHLNLCSLILLGR